MLFTAFDPAGALFDFYPENRRLVKSDAELVIVIHSDPWLNGYYKSCGHVDFWINGRPLIQPGCDPVSTTSRKPGDVLELGALSFMKYNFNYLTPFLFWTVFCNHFLSYRVGAYSILNPEAFSSRKCDSYANYKLGKCDNNDLQYVGDHVTSS